MASSSSASLNFNPAAIRIGIIGLGCVGLPLAVEFARKYRVVGFDTKQSRIDELNRGEDSTREDSTREVDPAELHQVFTPLLPEEGCLAQRGGVVSRNLQRKVPLQFRRERVAAWSDA